MWTVTLSDGSIVKEEVGRGTTSPWRALMEACETAGVFPVALRMMAFGKRVECPANAEGYWHARSVFAVMGRPPLHSEGIGWVEGDTLTCLWVNDKEEWVETRSPEAHVIWRQ